MQHLNRYLFSKVFCHKENCFLICILFLISVCGSQSSNEKQSSTEKLQQCNCKNKLNSLTTFSNATKDLALRKVNEKLNLMNSDKPKTIKSLTKDHSLLKSNEKLNILVLKSYEQNTISNSTKDHLLQKANEKPISSYEQNIISKSTIDHPSQKANKKPFSSYEQKLFSNSTIEYLLQKANKTPNILKFYESSFSNDTLSHDHDDSGQSSSARRMPRSQPAKLGDLKHHVFFLKPYNKRNIEYRAYCAGSIIHEKRVLTSAQCFYTNRKRLRHELSKLRVVGGLLTTVQNSTGAPAEQQWSIPTKVFSQKFYRFPAYSLAVVEVDKVWNFNAHVNKIPIAKSELDYDGVCVGTVVKITKSWAYKKYLFTEHHKIIPRQTCERTLLRTCRLYICTIAEGVTAESEAAGGGLVCFETGTQEEDADAGLLVGVTVLINMGLPSLNHRVAMFQNWVTDGTTHPTMLRLLILICFCLIKFLR